MAVLGGLGKRMSAAIRAFREPDLISDPSDLMGAVYGSHDARRMRYAINWAFFENTAYSTAHRWALKYRQEYGLYRYIRHLYNPAHRLAEFWQAHTWGGTLDREAGNGEETPTAIPILTDNERLRPAIAQIWEWSRWASHKDVITLRGAVLGDTVLQVTDDVDRGKVYLEWLHPGLLADVVVDRWGNVKAYTIEEPRPDPRNVMREVLYREICTRDGDWVLYQTFLDDLPWAWDDKPQEWAVPYGFVPMVLIPHNNVGLVWGWGEMHPKRALFQEADNVASLLHDQIARVVNPAWLMAGVDDPQKGRTAHVQPTARESWPNPYPQRERDEMKAIWAPGSPNANAQALVAPLDIAGVITALSSTVEELEREYPELQMDIWAGDKAASGRALRQARARVESKVDLRRVNYDDGLRRALQMAIAIGGWRGYAPEFAGFGLDSYASGALDLHVGQRPAFRPDPLDETEIADAFWSAAEKAGRAGMPLTAFLRREGWSDVEIAELEANPEWQAKQQALQAMLLMGVDGGASEGRAEDETATE